jgi:hypothetical protein
MATLDFFDFSRDPTQEYLGPRRLPMVAMISGLGTLHMPYHLDFQKDPYLKSLIYLNKRSKNETALEIFIELNRKLPLFFANLNSLLGKLNFHKFTSLIAKDLDSILELIQQANSKILCHGNLRGTLYLFDNIYDAT